MILSGQYSASVAFLSKVVSFRSFVDVSFQITTYSFLLYHVIYEKIHSDVYYTYIARFQMSKKLRKNLKFTAEKKMFFFFTANLKKRMSMILRNPKKMTFEEIACQDIDHLIIFKVCSVFVSL